MVRAVCLMFSCFFVFMSCKKETSNVPQVYQQTIDTANFLKTATLIVTLEPKSLELVKDWPEYQKVSELVSSYQEITLSDALLNSNELEELARQLKDSVRIEKLNQPAVRMRLNVFHNETLRLADMSTIPVITEEEVIDTNNKIIESFSALNSKLNNLNRREQLNSELNNFIQEQSGSRDSLRFSSDEETVSDSLE